MSNVVRQGGDIVHLCVLLVVLFFVGKTVSMTTTDITEDQDSQAGSR